MLTLLALLLFGPPAPEPSVAAVVGLRTGAHYWTVFVRPAPSQGYAATTASGLVVPSVAGLVFVDVVGHCSKEDLQQDRSPQQYLSIGRVTGRLRPAPCQPTSETFDRPRTVTVLFAGHQYISVLRYGESVNGRGSWHLGTRAWGEDTLIPMARLLPADVVARVDRWAAEQREQGIARALSEGLTGDADPCWYPDPRHDLWAIARSNRRWVVMALLESSCTTDETATPIPVPDAVVDGSRNQNPGVALPRREGPGSDIVVSPDGLLAVVKEGGSVLLRTVEHGTLGETLADAAVPVPEDPGEIGVVMVQWFDGDALSKWLPALEEAMGSE